MARDIEDPFHYDPNELPLPQLQYKLNERLLSVSHARRPMASTDIGELSGPHNTVVLPEQVQRHQCSTASFPSIEIIEICWEYLLDASSNHPAGTVDL